MAMTAIRISQALNDGELYINPYNEKQLSVASYDVALAPQLLVYQNRELDARRPNPVREVLIPDEGLVLEPGILYLGSTIEWINLVGVEAVLDGKSSNGRLSIRIHATAGYLDPGFRGQVTCEIDVVQSVRIYAFMLIGQLRFTKPDGLITAYKGKYQDQYGPTPSRSYLDQNMPLTPG